jgi:allantoin racemase
MFLLYGAYDSRMRIRLIAPTADYCPATLAAIQSDLQMLAREGVELEHVQLEHGPLTIRTREDEALATPGMTEKIIQAEKDGVDAVIVDCTSDVGVKETRQLVRIPVIAPGEILQQKVAAKHAVWLTAEDLAGEPLNKVLQATRDGIDVVVIGGTGWSHVAKELEYALQERGLELPILDPLPAALDEAIGQLKAHRST